MKFGHTDCRHHEDWFGCCSIHRPTKGQSMGGNVAWAASDLPALCTVPPRDVAVAPSIWTSLQTPWNLSCWPAWTVSHSLGQDPRDFEWISPQPQKKNGPRQPERRKEIEIAAHVLRVSKHIYINKKQFIWINWTNPLTWKVGLAWICYPTHPQSNSHHSSDIAESSRHRFHMLFPLFLLVHSSHLVWIQTAWPMTSSSCSWCNSPPPNASQNFPRHQKERLPPVQICRKKSSVSGSNKCWHVVMLIMHDHEHHHQFWMNQQSQNKMEKTTTSQEKVCWPCLNNKP